MRQQFGGQASLRPLPIATVPFSWNAGRDWRKLLRIELSDFRFVSSPKRRGHVVDHPTTRSSRLAGDRADAGEFRENAQARTVIRVRDAQFGHGARIATPATAGGNGGSAFRAILEQGGWPPMGGFNPVWLISKRLVESARKF